MQCSLKELNSPGNRVRDHPGRKSEKSESNFVCIDQWEVCVLTDAEPWGQLLALLLPGLLCKVFC